MMGGQTNLVEWSNKFGRWGKKVEQGFRESIRADIWGASLLSPIFLPNAWRGCCINLSFVSLFNTAMAYYAIFRPQDFSEKYCQHRYLHWNLLQIEKEYRWGLRAKMST